jgi:glycosyltransferase involved in cell wall biosynthesis
MQSIPNWVGVSGWIIEELRGVFACSPKSVQVIYNPVDCALFYPAAQRANGQTVLFVGTLEGHKGELLLAEAANHFLATFPDCRLVFVGRHTEAHKRGLIEVVRESLRHRVEVRPALPHGEVAEIMRQATVFSMPSPWETFGMVYAEAMASGVPVVACDCTGVSEVVPHEVAGLLVAPGDATALGKAIERLLGDQDLRRRFGRNGRALAVERFGLEQCVSATLAFYENCLNGT